MTDLFAARSQMAISLGFHIVFAAIGVAILFATGAVSGTVLSFELGLLWPKFMEHAGAIIGMPFSWEGTAFFLEAIALGIFLYGWDRIRPWVHWGSGIVVGVSGVL